MYGYQDQNSELTLQEGLEEYYSINPNFKLLSDKDGNEGLFYKHDLTHVWFAVLQLVFIVCPGQGMMALTYLAYRSLAEAC